MIARASGPARALVFLVIVIAGIGFARWLDTPEIRYRKYYLDLYDLIFNQTGRVDLAAIGSSRSQCMFGAQEFEQAITAVAQSKPVIYNLSPSMRGREFQHTVLRDLVAHREVDRLLIHFDWREKTEPIHPFFYQMGTFLDLWRVSLADEQFGYVARIHQFANLAMKKITSAVIDSMVGSLQAAQPKAPETARTGEYGPANPIRPLSLRPAYETRGKNGLWRTYFPDYDWPLDAPFETLSVHYMNKILALRSYGVRSVQLYYIPEFYMPLIAQDMVEKAEARFQVPVHQPDYQFLARLWPAGYADITHGNDLGRRLYMNWLAKHIRW